MRKKLGFKLVKRDTCSQVRSSISFFHSLPEPVKNELEEQFTDVVQFLRDEGNTELLDRMFA